MFFVRKWCGKKESPLTFLLSNKVKGEKNIKDLFRYFMSKGGRLWKGKVLAPFPSMGFHGLSGTCSFLKLLVFVCFENCFENALVRRFDL